ncbi:MAG: hypothetical protein A2418_03370 [Candidatus Brennerbacteria bacterium RIFOXYC1_FULL_41_11]|uniref:LTD domain-containing protein n=1 Tax=Candidatus Brennerbacteria bacterium RIFOXYD1_FULL_41_16 TaxID=1797529 RepID=A0A1G1XKZ7_9BACT|nr:MAG: hypothetical protein A2391_01050 [Candidatus Brennerbacteria bacterium RIFOXYB1_FULL_41_13]OGY40115.1 MAG: hypothetical protein A2418_03370 [Candidatus Brennerbacteria bacterium RIFOXYC1_FULL_41_11]OGY40678.1 MAG: hypothetical protein A2570_00915 [Candidatus Brennerbacteria bacterium RIFOXYD1_FULL_41_16]
MKTIIQIVFIFIFSFIKTFTTSAEIEGLRINEIMYSPINGEAEEWVELYNPGEIEIKIIGGTGRSAWTLVDSSGPHFLSEQPEKGSLSIGPKEYLVIANDAGLFLAKHQGFSGSVVDTTMSMPNDFGYLQVRNGLGITISQAIWSFHLGADRNGKTLEFDGGIFREGIRDTGTPGEKNSVDGLLLPPAPSPVLPSTKPTPSIQIIQQRTGKIAINEVFYSPGRNSQPWIELKNNETQIISLDGWKIVELNVKKETFLKNPIPGNSFRIIALPGLNKKTETLQLFDAENKKVFEVKYSSQIPQDWSASRFENSSWKITSRPSPEKENVYFIPKEIKEIFVPQELIPIINFENATANQLINEPSRAEVNKDSLITNGLLISSSLTIIFVFIKKKLLI